MAPGQRSYFQNPFERNDDASHASIFLVAILLLVGVAAILFYGTTWALPSESSSVLSLNLQRLQPRAASTPAAMPTARLALPSPGPAAPASSGPAMPTVTPAPGTSDPTSGAAGPAPTPTPVPVSAQAPNQVGLRRAVVANSGSDLAFLRRTPSLSDRLLAWPDGTPLQLLGEETDSQGIHWLKVRDPRGNVGWMPQQYVQAVGQ